MIIFCFDRDATVSTSRGPVPISAVRALSEDHDVWAIGNQALRGEADIPGMKEAREQSDTDPSDLEMNRDHVRGRARARRLRIVEHLYPTDEEVRFIHIDDVNVGAGNWDRWEYFSPEAFVESSYMPDPE